MADNMRWFKVWTTLLADYFLEDIPLEDVGRFALLGCLIAKKGSKGKYEIENDALKKLLKCEKIPENFLKSFNVDIVLNDNGTSTVSFKNWTKYQKDSTGYKRLKEWRKKQDDNGVDNANDNGDKTKKKTKTKTKTKKKTKKKEGEIFSSEDPLIKKNPIWLEWIQYRKEKRNVLTPSTIEKQLKMLSEYPLSIQIKMLEQSITNGWVGIFPLKEDKNADPDAKTRERARIIKEATNEHEGI